MISEDQRPRLAEIRAHDAEDEAWARERVTRMAASALVDAQVYRRKLLKGFGYPNETMRAAQDYRALSIVLDLLASSESVRGQLEQENERLQGLPVSHSADSTNQPPEFGGPMPKTAPATKTHDQRLEELADWLTKHHGVKDPQTAWDLAIDLEPIVTRLAESCRDVVTK